MSDQQRSKIALLSGGGSGITLAFARLLHADGYSVVIADLRLHQEAEEWMRSQTGPHSPRIVFQPTDVTDRAQLVAGFDRCEVEFGACPDIVVPGAGVYEPSSFSFWDDSDPTNGYKILDINLVHPIRMARIAIRRFVQANKAGTVVCISSIAGQRSTIVTPLYTVSKHGINSFVRGMAPLQDMVGIRIVGVAPGTVSTPLFTEHPEAMKFLDPTKDYLLTPDAVGRAMMALVKEREKYPPGTILEVCDEHKWRITSLLNDPGPQGPASLTSHKLDAIKTIQAILDAERDGNV